MSPFEVYKTFLSLKNHFSKKSYDVFKYNWKTRASIDSFNRRKDKYFFERMSRKKQENEIKEFFVSNFVNADSPDSVYIPEIIKSGELVYTEWKKRIQSLSYMFQAEVEVFIQPETFDDFFYCRNGVHPLLIKKYLQRALSFETLVILDCIVDYVKDYDKILDDPVWEMLSLKIIKYKPFLNIDIDKYTKILKEIVM